MKRVYIFSILALSLFASLAHADLLPLAASVSDKTVSVTLNGLPATTGYKYTLVSNPSLPTLTPPENYTKSPSITRSRPYVSWTIPNVPDGTYVLYVKKEDPLTAGTIGGTLISTAAIAKVGAGEQKDFFSWPLTATPDKNTGSVQLKGTLDTNTLPAATNPYIYFEVADSVAAFDTPPTVNSPRQPFYEATVALTGDYQATLSSLSPDTKYFFRQIIKTSKDATDFLSVKTGDFNSSKGVIIAGSAADKKDFENRSYRLLAPWPGLSVLMDPSLCDEQRNSGTLPAGAICSINDLLNYLFKVFVGLTAVALVLRLMIAGYQMITTESGIVKAVEKTKFVSSLVGLLLALSAYLILNTINPKLVTNDVALDKVTVAVEDDYDVAAPTTFIQGKDMPSGVYCPGSGKGSAVEQIARSWEGKITYSRLASDGKTPSGKNPALTSDGTAHLDCSGFVVTVLKCAGYTANNKTGVDFVNSGTAAIFTSPGAEKVTGPITNTSINGKELRPGDLVGFIGSGGGIGHVLVYIGNGKVAESHGGKKNGVYPTGGAFAITDVTKHNIQYIKRISN